jgi:hypothetical protein
LRSQALIADSRQPLQRVLIWTFLGEGAVPHLPVERRTTEAGAFLHGLETEDSIGGLGLQ